MLLLRATQWCNQILILMLRCKIIAFKLENDFACVVVIIFVLILL